MVVSELRTACAQVAAHARHVRIDEASIPLYAVSLPLPPTPPAQPPALTGDARAAAAAFWLALDAINFGSGWFPTLRKADGRSGYMTISGALRDAFALDGAWSAEDLRAMSAARIAQVTGQDPDHELMVLFARSLRDLGRHIGDHGDDPLAVVDAAGGSAARLVQTLAGWDCFADTSVYGTVRVPFLKRAQIAAADLHRAGVCGFEDLHDLTMFADNLVPHVLRLDGVLSFEPELVARIENGSLIEHGSPEEVEIRACAVEAVEQIAAAAPGGPAPATIDEVLWHRGQGPRYKARPRHRCRCTAY